MSFPIAVQLSKLIDAGMAFSTTDNKRKMQKSEINRNYAWRRMEAFTSRLHWGMRWYLRQCEGLCSGSSFPPPCGKWFVTGIEWCTRSRIPNANVFCTQCFMLHSDRAPFRRCLCVCVCVWDHTRAQKRQKTIWTSLCDLTLHHLCCMKWPWIKTGMSHNGWFSNTQHDLMNEWILIIITISVLTTNENLAWKVTESAAEWLWKALTTLNKSTALISACCMTY